MSFAYLMCLFVFVAFGRNAALAYRRGDRQGAWQPPPFRYASDECGGHFRHSLSDSF